MSSLRINNHTVNIFDEKIEVLKNVFFSFFSFANLRNIVNFSYSISQECLMIITKVEIKQTISRFRVDKTSSSDEISNRILKTCFETLIVLLILLFQTCVILSYHSRVFRMTHTITLKKSRKVDYIIANVYRSIVLLNTLSKILKSIIEAKISFLTKHYKLLFETQMRVRRNKFTKTILKLLTEQIYTIWKQKIDKMTTLLSMNIADVFLTISHSRLIHNLRKCKISEWIVKWIDSFLRERSITLIIQKRITDVFEIRTKISQKSLLYFILYLFYSADLLNMCDKLDIDTSDFDFVDDVNILIYEKTIEKNCATLKRLHEKCAHWARRHNVVFASTKYELIHLIRNLKKFNMTVCIKIERESIASKTDIRVLRLQIDIKLKWESHVRKIQNKMTRQSMTFSKISIFTWNVIFARIRQIYIVVLNQS